jgi:colanic acid/amylovoran biosynthesis glycosyltransferase
MIHYITPIGIGSAWVGNEISVVQRAGIPVVLHSMRPSRQKFFSSEWAKELDRSTRVIYPVPPLALAASVAAAPFLFGGRFFAALANALFGKRENLRCRVAGIWHFLTACHWARGLRRNMAAEPVSLIHSQWIHSGGTIGMYGAWLLGVPFSFTGHAADLFRERCALEDKVRRAESIICISTFHRDLYKKLGARDEQLHIVYCGIDVSHFVPRPRPPREGRRVRILSSGRLVEKKGFAHLVDACRILADRGIDFECVIGGDGPLEKPLREQVARLGLEDRVSLTGKPLTQEELPSFMHGGDIYVLACVWASDGDVDGLPQMLMEAMACGLPAVSTRLVGIPDLIEDGKSGVLVEPGDPKALADALETLIRDEHLSSTLAAAGERRVRERFEIEAALQPLIRLFRAKLAASGGGAAQPVLEDGRALGEERAGAGA